MLVQLPTKEIAKVWDVFKDIIRECIPQARGMMVDRFQVLLYAAMTNKIQCWLAFEEGGIDKDNLPMASCYGGLITKISRDELTGQRVLLIYALGLYKSPSREERNRDFAELTRLAKEWGCTHITAFCRSNAVANSLLKLSGGKGHIENYVLIDVED